MSSFASEIQSWHEFFALTGAASATLIGLLFVAVSLRADIRSQAEDSYFRTVVNHNILSYITVLLFSLYFVIPDLTPTSIASPVIITAAVVFLTTVRNGMRLRTAREMEWESFWWGFLVPALCQLAAIVVGIALARNHPGAMGWFVAVIAFLITVPTINAWRLLLESHEES
ncbi:MAG TPA: hypothetical protein VNZ58_05515 [Thermomicrobiales bacterium]|nr:hypothetical protein [Thermomicrobiales bacterium]